MQNKIRQKNWASTFCLAMALHLGIQFPVQALQFVNINRVPWISQVNRGQDTLPLFHLSRSTNRNLVHYALYFDKGKLRVSTPLAVYWELMENHGKVEDLSELEKKKAYGPIYEKKDDTQIIFSIAALPDARIMVENKLCASELKWHATIKQDHLELSIERIFVQALGQSFFPKVEYVDVWGKNCSDGVLNKIRFLVGK